MLVPYNFSDWRKLVLEITESMTIDVEYAQEIIQQFRQMNVNISIDDFGTGYSSLYYLKKFALTQLKIDQSFVRDIFIDKSTQDIVITIISMAHHLDIEVIAEGVETKEQLDFLKRHGCDEAQGYYFYKPMPAEELNEILKAPIHK
ncbi:EAL domain-containing protein [Salipaludibacillus keqinensis]|nr:EAL domain-containing protein [Salipaludibacillus keqinensis]